MDNRYNMATDVDTHSSETSALDGYTDGLSLAEKNETERLLCIENHVTRDSRWQRRRLQCLFASNIVFLVLTLALAAMLLSQDCRDPSLRVYCMSVVSEQFARNKDQKLTNNF